MRWIFNDPKNADETAFRQATLMRIDAWWKSFVQRASDIEALFSRRAEWDLPLWIHQTLNIIDPRLMWEFGPAVRTKGHRLVITPESVHELRPLVATILKQAPTIPGWEFYDHRLAESFEVANPTVQARTGGSLDGCSFRASVGKHNRIDLVFASPVCTGPDDEQVLRDAFVASETLLGEDMLDQWVGAIEVEKSSEAPRWFGLRKPRNAPRSLPLDRLYETFTALCQSIKDQLPSKPLHQFLKEGNVPAGESMEGSQRVGSVLKIESRLEGPTEEDYPQQDDLFVASTAMTDLWMATHDSRAFYSARYSRHGETFAYLKIDGREPLDDKFADRMGIEEAIDNVLISSQAGCVIGGGTGRIYSYIELAFTDLQRGVELVREILSGGNIHKRTWLLFHDRHLSAEWVGIYDDTPPPPMTPERDNQGD